jgi:hypothetical protein
LNQVFDHTSLLKTVMNCFILPNDALGNRAREAIGLEGAVNLDEARTDHPPIPQPANMEVSAAEQTVALGRWLMHASQKPITDLHKASLVRIAQRLGRTDLAAQAQDAKSVFDAEAVAVKLEAELWKQRRARAGSML